MTQADIINSDIKALLTLLLLKSGATSSEIQTALQLAATSRMMELQQPESHAEHAPEARRPTPKQVVRNDHLAPIPFKAYAA